MKKNDRVCKIKEATSLHFSLTQDHVYFRMVFYFVDEDVIGIYANLYPAEKSSCEVRAAMDNLAHEWHNKPRVIRSIWKRMRHKRYLKPGKIGVAFIK